VTSNYICFILLITLIIVVDIFVGVVRCNNNILYFAKALSNIQVSQKKNLIHGEI
jgi:hypothetical protein